MTEKQELIQLLQAYLRDAEEMQQICDIFREYAGKASGLRLAIKEAMEILHD